MKIKQMSWRLSFEELEFLKTPTNSSVRTHFFKNNQIDTVVGTVCRGSISFALSDLESMHRFKYRWLLIYSVLDLPDKACLYNYKDVIGCHGIMRLKSV